MPARKKSNSEINLLPQKGFQTSTAGRVLAWILSTFRVIVIVTEMIVMVAFLSRFWLDAQNTDLNEKIQQKQNVLKASQEFETRFKDVQKRLQIMSEYAEGKVPDSDIIAKIKYYLPGDTILSEISVENSSVRVIAVTGNERNIQQFIINLSSDKKFKEVNLTAIKSVPENPALIRFNIDMESVPDNT